MFWGSGVLKDTITISAVGWFTYSFYRFFINKRRSLKYLLALLVNSLLIIKIKPYIYFALLPGSVVWLATNVTTKVKSKIVKNFITPFIIILGAILGYLALSQMDNYMGKYKMDKVFAQAARTQADQKAEYYGGNSFDIGEFDGTFSGAIGKTHLAIAATFFRPYLWDVKNVVMFISALENTYILLLTIFLFIKLKLSFLSLLFKNPMLTFSILFALFFGFSVGLATSNFGSLVRLKIPCIPFYVASLFILRHFYELKHKKKLGL